MRVIIAGGRDFNDYERLCKIMKKAQQKITIECVVCGKARGVDSLGERWALENAVRVEYFIPDWGGLGKRAGFVRNSDMKDYANEHGDGCLIAFWDKKSKGTENMIKLVEDVGMLVKVYKY